MFVEEVELERLNLARTSDDVIADKLAAVEERLRSADEITLDGAGRLTTDGESMDASPEFAAMYQSLMQTATIPGLPDDLAGPPAEVGPFGAWELAAAAVGTAAGKEVPITVDTIEYYNRVIGFPPDADYTSPWGVDFLRSADPDTGEEMTEGDRFVDYGNFTYNRSETFRGSVTWLDVDKMQWQVDPVTEVVDFTNLTAAPVGDRTLEGVTAFAQLADDVRAVIAYYHDHEVIPGFYIDPVGVDTTEEQQAAITNPAVDLGALPADVFLTQPFDMTASLFNPWGGSEIDKARLRVVVDAEADLVEGDLTAVAKEDGQAVSFTEDGGNLVGWWGPEDGFPVPPGYKTSTAFDVTVAGDAEPGAYDVTLELVDVDDPDTVLATDQESTTVNAATPTVLWGDALPKFTTQGTAIQVPVSVYSPTDGTADLTLTVQGPGDDPTTDLVEELRAGDVKVYGSDGSDMVPMPMTLAEDGSLTGTWSMPVTQGFTDQTWYLTVTEGALVGNYAVDVALEGGNRLEAATIAVEAPASHGNQPPGAGEDTTAPTVTIEVVGTLGSTATFLLSADEPDVTYQVRLAKDDVKPDWETTTQEEWTYQDLEPGIYSFEVKATDAAGNTSGRFSKTWMVSAPGDFGFDRIAGSDRYETASKVAEEYGDSTEGIVVNGEPGNYADALTANYLSGVKDAPILLTQADQLEDDVLQRLADMGAENVTVVGGQSMVSEAQVAELEGEGYTVDRVAGADRFDTNADVIAAGGDAGETTALVATGFNFADALAGGPLAYKGHPMALTAEDSIDSDVVDALIEAGVEDALILGGENAVDPAVEQQLDDAGIEIIERLAGQQRQDTAVEVADYSVENLGASVTGVNVASGSVSSTGADALSGGPLTGKQNRPLLITKTADAPGDSVVDYVTRHNDTLEEGVIFGGDAAVSVTGIEAPLTAAVRGD